MCIICVELVKASLSTNEMRSAFREVKDSLSIRHLKEVEEAVENYVPKKKKEEPKP